jgi:transposase
LEEIFPNIYNKILTLSFHQIADHTPDLYCKNWVMKNDCKVNPIEIASQRISELYRSIDISDINKFYQSWSTLISENEFVATDITSISSYSEKTKEVAFGYNRDHEKLKQINLCLLFGEKSHLPIYSVKYHGSLADVKTFCTTVDQISLLGNFKYKLVMDKGFYSAKNINWMFKKQINFLVGVPAKPNNIKDLVVRNLDLDTSPNNLIKIGNDYLYYKSLVYDWSIKDKTYVHLYLNKDKNYSETAKIIYEIKDMQLQAIKNPEKYIHDEEFKKYLNIIKSKKCDKKYDVTIKEKIMNNIVYKGRIVLISDIIDDAYEAIKIYRNKNVVEEGFNKVKNYLELYRLRVQGDKATESKIFVTFISLVLVAYMHKKMLENNLYKSYTLKELFDELNLMKKVYIKNKVIYYPITAKQESILKKLGCPLPF